MLIYLKIKTKRDIEGRALTHSDLYDVIMEGAVERVRPKMMTVVAIMAGFRARREYENCQIAWPDRAAGAARECRRGDRIT